MNGVCTERQIIMSAINVSSEDLAKSRADIKVGARVMAAQSGRYSFKRGIVTADEGSSFRVKFDEAALGEVSVPKFKIVPPNASCVSTNSVVRNALATANASGGSSFYKSYADKAHAALREIQYEAESAYRNFSSPRRVRPSASKAFSFVRNRRKRSIILSC